ncbi:methyltransferase domain-containing protein [Bosea sp. ASV33]|uniref:methyltransferase domain-containing protein n=1 Tax=Bosea sp. ASV33 TaxID=2795106 RepID=UPI0018EDF65F|nr:methyltransferase domain-containing protein [Bosea sp. ASV33]
MSATELPRAFEPHFYRQHCQNAANLSDEMALAHYKAEGIQAGFMGSPAAERGALLSFIEQGASVLEIGPFHSPSVTGERVRYLDVFSTDELTKLVEEAGHDTSRVPTIHYVAPKGGFDMVDQTFDAVFSGHCIEHQPDLVRHLQGVSGILEEDGRYFIACPDKRFCFDHFAPASGVADVLAAHHAQRAVHQPRSFIVQKVHRAHNDGDRHWAADHGSQQYETYSDPKAEIFKDLPDDDAYHDTHAWQFTPSSFFEIMSFLYRIGMIDLAPERVYQTRANSQEFTAVLRKGKSQETRDEASFVPQDAPGQKSGLVLSYENLLAELDRARADLATTKVELANAKAELASVYASHSWGITEPLRRLRTGFGRTRK